MFIYFDFILILDVDVGDLKLWESIFIGVLF